MGKLMLNLVVISLLLCLASALTRKQAAERMNNCMEFKAYGECHGSHTRWFYDTMTNNCKTFVYSGCGGNFNRFSSASQCFNYCTHKDISYDRK
ncbi:PI-stichotoxin-She2b-like [Drosophila persimilis]|uniref:PI-stichotoxin-She2b-like n=1 Tax=Drosophila persimilis TaxID=7234 RepID=UPI000F07E88B|nr:PI-stichotoxin-She2b-like [Drosophila persimilis]